MDHYKLACYVNTFDILIIKVKVAEGLSSYKVSAMALNHTKFEYRNKMWNVSMDVLKVLKSGVRFKRLGM
ncbi:hypothetical protein CHS0354_035880 [Potamilus streckersoni]|uniref:Uncharacterized protein n=1 Tax=Potamilus streckersoni TaxID=2493646 RepID=A0AAE0SS49_9BIVA|nr:hypothetical protein CHS0354_035880 [Potamilus streckersoni]